MKMGPTRSLCLALLMVTALARAQDEGPPDADPPDRAARLSYVQGEVSMQPAGEEDWAPALLNRPLTTGDKLWTGHGARAEVYVGQSAVRLDGGTGFSFLNVDDHTIQMRVTAGVVNVNVRALEDNDQVEIDTPNIALYVMREGNYRVEVNDAGDATVVKVRDGEAQATGPSQENVIVHERQVVTFRGIDRVDAQLASLGAPDEFDSWSMDRDARDVMAATRTSQYVSPDVTGYEDLDANGTWSSEPEYGYVWTPTYVAADWSPYRYGRWLWVRPWGWTWIDDASWGYAPSHYGRWTHIRNRWCWVPGPRAVRAVYAPALVGWVGSPGVAWFPLGPREVYVPARRYSTRYVERVNITNTVVNRNSISDVVARGVREVRYQNRLVPGAVTAVQRDAFTAGGRVANHRVQVTEQEIESAQTSAAAPHIAPVHESRYGGPTRVNMRPPPSDVVNRPVVVRRNPPPPPSTRFARGVGDPVESPRVMSAPKSPPRDRPAVRQDTQQGQMQQDIQQRVREQQDRERQSRDQAQRREESMRESAARQSQERARNVEPEHRQEHRQPERAATQKPVESKPEKPKNNYQRVRPDKD